MDSMNRVLALDSLRDLESHYQSKYEYYLAQATIAAKHRESVGLLIQDLSKELQEDEHQSLGSLKANLELPQSEAESESDRMYDQRKLSDNSSGDQFKQMKQWFQSLSQAINVIEFVCKDDSGKALHKSYLHKTLNRELEQELSMEVVNLYLEEAVNRGLIKRDEFDHQCYQSTIVISNNTSSHAPVPVQSNERTQNLSQVLATTKEDTIETSVPNQEENTASTSRRKPYDLPESNKLKPTLLATIEQYIALHAPKRFSIEDVVNYLYPQKQQLEWSQNKKNKVRSCIANVLGRKVYLGKYWKRVKPGIYRPV